MERNYDLYKQLLNMDGIPGHEKEIKKFVKQELQKAGIRVELDDRNEKIGYKIREAQIQKVPYMLVIGDKEVENKAVGVRSRKDGDIGQMRFEEFKQKLQEEIENKSL